MILLLAGEQDDIQNQKAIQGEAAEEAFGIESWES